MNRSHARDVIECIKYPVAQRDAQCKEYVYSFDWDAISQSTRQNGAAVFEVSSSLDLFPHLQLDENYQLFCYVGYEYHGLWGRVAAIQKGSATEPTVDPEKDLLFHGHRFELPETTVPPMEAIYHDGTPKGYLEALLLEEMLSAIPYTRWEQEMWDECMIRHPKDYPEAWDVDVDLPDWSPRLKYDPDGFVTLTVCWRHFENGLGASDGLDRVRITQHSFHSTLSSLRLCSSDRRDMYKTHIEGNSRYTAGRHCCVNSKSSILLAIQKDSYI